MLLCMSALVVTSHQELHVLRWEDKGRQSTPPYIIIPRYPTRLRAMSSSFHGLITHVGDWFLLKIGFNGEQIRFSIVYLKTKLRFHSLQRIK